MRKRNDSRPEWLRKRVFGKPKWQQKLIYFFMDDRVSAFVPLIIPVGTYWMGWVILTVIITPLFAAPLIMFLGEKWHNYSYPNQERVFDHKAGMGVFIILIIPFALIFWTTCAIILN